MMNFYAFLASGCAAILISSQCAAQSAYTPVSHERIHLNADTGGPIRVQEGPLQARIESEQLLGRNSLRLIISNPSDEFYCVNSRLFDPVYQHIVLKDQSGRDVPLRSYGEIGQNTLLGFNYNEGYIFLLPRLSKSIAVDLQNFQLRAGEFRYEVYLTYYKCRDVIDGQRFKAKVDIGTYYTKTTGAVLLKPEG